MGEEHDPVLLTIPQCCSILQIGRTRLYEYLDAELPVTRLGKSVRIHRDDLDQFIQERRQGANKTPGGEAA